MHTYVRKLQIAVFIIIEFGILMSFLFLPFATLQIPIFENYSFTGIELMIYIPKAAEYGQMLFIDANVTAYNFVYALIIIPLGSMTALLVFLFKKADEIFFKVIKIMSSLSLVLLSIVLFIALLVASVMSDYYGNIMNNFQLLNSIIVFGPAFYFTLIFSVAGLLTPGLLNIMVKNGFFNEKIALYQ